MTRMMINDHRRGRAPAPQARASAGATRRRDRSRGYTTRQPGRLDAGTSEAQYQARDGHGLWGRAAGESLARRLSHGPGTG